MKIRSEADEGTLDRSKIGRMGRVMEGGVTGLVDAFFIITSLNR